jgi:hypothetical protein
VEHEKAGGGNERLGVGAGPRAGRGPAIASAALLINLVLGDVHLHLLLGLWLADHRGMFDREIEDAVCYGLSGAILN